jgi:hypothetical protein
VAAGIAAFEFDHTRLPMRSTASKVDAPSESSQSPNSSAITSRSGISSGNCRRSGRLQIYTHNAARLAFHPLDAAFRSRRMSSRYLDHFAEELEHRGREAAEAGVPFPGQHRDLPESTQKPASK